MKKVVLVLVGSLLSVQSFAAAPAIGDKAIAVMKALTNAGIQSVPSRTDSSIREFSVGDIDCEKGRTTNCMITLGLNANGGEPDMIIKGKKAGALMQAFADAGASVERRQGSTVALWVGMVSATMDLSNKRGTAVVNFTDRLTQ